VTCNVVGVLQLLTISDWTDLRSVLCNSSGLFFMFNNSQTTLTKLCVTNWTLVADDLQNWVNFTTLYYVVCEIMKYCLVLSLGVKVIILVGLKYKGNGQSYD
jgi:hypothetical protein